MTIHMGLMSAINVRGLASTSMARTAMLAQGTEPELIDQVAAAAGDGGARRLKRPERDQQDAENERQP